MDARAAAARWAATWQRAWVAGEADAIVALYADDARFTSQPFRPVEVGRDGLRGYIEAAFRDESDVRAWFGVPIVDGARASVKWWAALREDGEEVTLAGTSTLAFDGDGLVVEQRDSWNLAPGRSDPPEGWGGR